MNALVTQTAEMLPLLPDEELSLVNTLVKKLIVAWDPDFTKVTPAEKKILDQADQEMADGIFCSDDEVWS